MSCIWPAWLTAMARWLAYYTHSYISKSCFFNTLDMKTKNQSLIDIMKTVAADIGFQYVSHVLFIREGYININAFSSRESQ